MTEEVKQVAKSIGKKLNHLGHKVPHTVLLEAVASALGKFDWATLKAGEKKGKKAKETCPILEHDSEPIPVRKLLAILDSGKAIEVVIPVDFDSLSDIDTLNDYASLKITGSEVSLMDIEYRVANHFYDEDSVAIRVIARDLDESMVPGYEDESEYDQVAEFQTESDRWGSGKSLIPCWYVTQWEDGGEIATAGQVDFMSGTAESLEFVEKEDDDLLKGEFIRIGNRSFGLIATDDGRYVVDKRLLPELRRIGYQISISYPLMDWHAQVNLGKTQDSYARWVLAQIENKTF